ncbi:hypothetical protein [Aureisphaera sp.]
MENKKQQIGIITFTLSYILMILTFFPSDHHSFLFFTSWFFGIVSYVSNLSLSVSMGMPKWLSLLLIITGLFWIIPPIALMTYFGIPFAIIFLLVVPVVHIEHHNQWEYHQMKNKI